MNLRSLSRRLFSRVAPSRRPAPIRNHKPLGRPLETLEDRSVPANVSITAATVTIDLNNSNEALTVHTDVSGQYILASTKNFIGDLSGAGPHTITPASGSTNIVITDSKSGTSVTFSNSLATYANAVSVLLNNVTAGGVTFTGSTNLGGKNLDVSANRTISVASGAALSSGSGSLTLDGNFTLSNGTGSFSGVDIAGNVSTGGGAITIRGEGGDTGADQIGVFIHGGAVISAGGAGTVSIQGLGGVSTGAGAIGVSVRDNNTRITSAGGSVSITGNGGGAGASAGNHGVQVGSSLFDNPTITAGGSGAVVVAGTGGAGSGGGHTGVRLIDGGVISSGGGTVTVTGTGGSAGSGNAGVEVLGTGWITSGGSGAVNVTGTGKTAAGTARGVWVNAGSILSNGGDVKISGTGAGTLAPDIQLSAGGVVQGGASGLTTRLIADVLDVDSTAIIRGGSAATQQVAFYPRTFGRAIDIGGADSATALGLSAGELDRVFAQAILVEDTASAVTVSSAVNPANLTTLFAIHGASVAVNAQLTASEVGLVAAVGGITTSGTGLDVATTTFSANAATGIDLDTSAQFISAFAVGGDITLDETDGAELTNVQTAAGNVAISSTSGTLSVVSLNASGSASLTADDVTSGAGNTITTGTGLTIDITGTASTLAGDVAGTTLTKEGTGTLILSGAKTYSGATTINNGTLLVNGAVSSNVTVNVNGTLGGSGPITGNVGGAGNVAPGSSPGILTINGDFTPTGTIAFEVNPPAATAGADFDRIVVNGGNVDLSAATLTFSGSTGAVTANKKVRIIDNTTPSKNTTPSASPAQGGLVTINGNNYRIYYNSGSNKNDVVLVQAGPPTTVYVDDDFAGNNAGDDIVDADQGTAGNQDATFGLNAFTTVNAALAVIAPGGTVVVNGGTYAETVGLTGTILFRIGGPDLSAGQAVTIDDLSSAATNTVQIDGASSLTVGTATDTTIAGPVTDTGSLIKQGAGTLALDGTNTYTGTTTINQGILQVNGSTTSDTTVNAGGTLGGIGTITGNVTGAGTVAAGKSPGILAIIGDFTPLGDVVFEVNPPAVAAGTDYDQIQVTGKVDLSAATLKFSGAAGVVSAGQLVNLITNDLADATTAAGTPAEVVPTIRPASNHAVTIGGVNYFIFYNGGDGNDVVLVQAAPGGSGAVFVNDGWAGFSNGSVIADVNPLVGGAQPGIKGITAFDDVAGALNMVASGGTVTVLGGSYTAFTLLDPVNFVLANDFGGDSTVSLNGAVALAGENFNVTLNQGAGLIDLATTSTVTGTGIETVTVTTTAGNAGSASFGGNLTGVSGVTLGAAGAKLDTISLGTVSTSAGGITTFSNDKTTLNASLNTDAGDVTMAAGAGIRLAAAAITIDTETGDDANAGKVDFSAANVSATAAGSSLVIRTATAFGGGIGGDVSLAGFNKAGGEYAVNLTVDADAATRGDITFGGASTISGDLDATGRDIVSNATFIAGTGGANTIALDATRDVIDGNGVGVRNFEVQNGLLSVDFVSGDVEADTRTKDFRANSTGTGDLAIREFDGINIAGGVTFDATAYFDLTTGGPVTQGAAVADAITGGSFRLITGAGGTVTLANAKNDVDSLAADVNGTTFFNDFDALTVGTVAGKHASTDGINTHGNDLTLVTGNLLTIGDAVGGTDNITAAGAIVDLFTNADGVLESNGAAITSASLRVAGTGTQFELADVNAVGILAANTTGGTFRFNNGATNLSVGTVTLNTVTTNGVTTDNRNATLATGKLSLDQVVNAGSGTARFTTQGGVAQAAAGQVTASSLGVSNTASGDIVLDGVANAIGTFAAKNTTGFVDLLNGVALVVDEVTADAPLFAGTVTGITTSGGKIEVQTTNTGSTLDVNRPVASSGGAITLATLSKLSALTTAAGAGGGSLASGGGAVAVSTTGDTSAIDLNGPVSSGVGDVSVSTTGATSVVNVDGGITTTTGKVTVSTTGDSATIGVDSALTTTGGAVSLSSTNANAGITTSVAGSIGTGGGVVAVSTTGDTAPIDLNGSVDSGPGTVTVSTTGGTSAVSVDGGITTTGAKVAVSTGGGTSMVDINSAIASGGGDVSLSTGGATSPVDIGGTVSSGGGAVSVSTTGAASQLFVTKAVTSAGGAIDFSTTDKQNLGANVTAGAGNVTLTSGGGVDQTAGAVSGTDIDLAGTGTFLLGGNNDATGFFGAGVVGPVTFRDATDLALRPVVNGVSTGGGKLVLSAGNNFTAIAGDAKKADVLVNAGGGEIVIVPGDNPGDSKAYNFTFQGELIGSKATFGTDTAVNPAANSTSNKFDVIPSKNLEITVFGNNPTQAQVTTDNVGDSLVPNLGTLSIAAVDLAFDDSNPANVLSGTYTVTVTGEPVARKLHFNQIEKLGGVGLRGMVVQTADHLYAIRIQRVILEPKGGSVTGQGLQPNPFVVTPSLVSEVSPYSAPNIAFGDLNGDGLPELVIANGAGDDPLVTVLNGSKLFLGGASGQIDLSNPGKDVVLARFYAISDPASGHPIFRGGLNVAVRRSPDGFGEIVIGAGLNGGPRVQTFRLARDVNGVPIQDPATSLFQVRETGSFFAFEESQRGGVNVAAGDYDGDGTEDLIVGAGPGGGPRVQVFSGKNQSVLANFFAYDPNFRGGVLVAAGHFDGDNKDDIATAPGFGGGPHIRVLQGGTAAELASFYAWDPTPTNGLQVSGSYASNGVGSISFGGPAFLSKNVPVIDGRQELLVASNPGTALQMKRFTFDAGATKPKTSQNFFTEMTVPGTTDEFGTVFDGIPIADPRRPGVFLNQGDIVNGGHVAGDSI